MAQAINRIHPKNTLISTFDNAIYQYQDTIGVWQKNNSIKYYKVFDIDPLTLNPEQEGFEVGDFILSYKSKYNHIKFSENIINNLRQESNEYNKQWLCSMEVEKGNQYNTCMLTSDAKYILPNNYDYATLLSSKNKSTTDTDHSLFQYLYPNTLKTYVFSTYIKIEEESSSNNVSLSMFNDTYDIGIFGEYDLSDASGFDSSGYKYLTPVYLDSNYQPKTHLTGDNEVFKNVKIGIQRITIDESLYFRLFVIARITSASQVSLKLNLRDINKSYKYNSKTGNKMSVYIGGFQLEELDEAVLKPDAYIASKSSTPTRLKLFHELYTVENYQGIKRIVVSGNSVYYIEDVKERLISTSATSYVIAESFKPEIPEPMNKDIAIVPSLISFSEENSSNVVKLGDNYHSEDPLYTIYYNKDLQEYRIKLDDGYHTLRYKSDKKNRTAMVKSMIFNQGYFETWSRQGKCDHRHGFNTGGCYNFWKLNKISKTL